MKINISMEYVMAVTWALKKNTIIDDELLDCVL